MKKKLRILRSFSGSLYLIAGVVIGLAGDIKIDNDWFLVGLALVVITSLSQMHFGISNRNKRKLSTPIENSKPEGSMKDFLMKLSPEQIILCIKALAKDRDIILREVPNSAGKVFLDEVEKLTPEQAAVALMQLLGRYYSVCDQNIFFNPETISQEQALEIIKNQCSKETDYELWRVILSRDPQTSIFTLANELVKKMEERNSEGFKDKSTKPANEEPTA